MAKINVKVTNADDLYMEVTATLPLAEWREILRITDHRDTKVGYYGPLVNFRNAIAVAIAAIEKREEVEYEFKSKETKRGNK